MEAVVEGSQIEGTAQTEGSRDMVEWARWLELSKEPESLLCKRCRKDKGLFQGMIYRLALGSKLLEIFLHVTPFFRLNLSYFKIEQLRDFILSFHLPEAHSSMSLLLLLKADQYFGKSAPHLYEDIRFSQRLMYGQSRGRQSWVSWKKLMVHPHFPWRRFSWWVQSRSLLLLSL